MLAAITLGLNRLMVNYIKELASQMGDLCVYKTLYSYPYPHELVQLLNVFTPEVVFLDIQSSEAALELAKEIRSCQPKAATIGFVTECDEKAIRAAREAGVTDILVVPCASEDFQQVVSRAIRSQAVGFSDNVIAFAKNAGLVLAIPYLHNGQMHDYVPDFLARLRWQGREAGTLILETKGYDDLAEIKQAAAERWVAAVSVDGRYGRWAYRLVRQIRNVNEAVESGAKSFIQ